MGGHKKREAEGTVEPLSSCCFQPLSATMLHHIHVPSSSAHSKTNATISPVLWTRLSELHYLFSFVEHCIACVSCFHIICVLCKGWSLPYSNMELVPASLELTMYTRLALNSQRSSCFSLLRSARITGVCHHARPAWE